MFPIPCGEILRHLLPNDRLGLVPYSDETITEIPMQLMTSENKEAALKKIKALHVTGSTSLSAAISLSFQELRSVTEINEVKSIFLLTDGHANRGISQHADIIEFTKNCADLKPSHRFLPSYFDKEKGRKKPVAKKPGKDTPCSMFCLGYGNDHNAALLRDISDAVESGSYYHVKDDSDVGSAFGDAMGGLLSVVAQSIVVTLCPTSGAFIKKVYHDRVVQRGNGTFTVNVGDLFAEEEKDVLVELSLAPKNDVDDSLPVPNVSASLMYADVITKKPAQSRALVYSIARPPGAEASKDNPHVAAQWLRVLGAREMEAATKYAELNDLARARASLELAINQIAAADEAVRNLVIVRILESDLKNVMMGLATRVQYRTSGSMFLQFKSQGHQTQRSNEASSTAPGGRPVEFT